MPELGFSVGPDFAATRRNARDRRNVDSLVKTRGRAPAEIYVALVVLAALAIVIARPNWIAPFLSVLSLH